MCVYDIPGDQGAGREGGEQEATVATNPRKGWLMLESMGLLDQASNHGKCCRASSYVLFLPSMVVNDMLQFKSPAPEAVIALWVVCGKAGLREWQGHRTQKLLGSKMRTGAAATQLPVSARLLQTAETWGKLLNFLGAQFPPQ